MHISPRHAGPEDDCDGACALESRNSVECTNHNPRGRGSLIGNVGPRTPGVCRCVLIVVYLKVVQFLGRLRPHRALRWATAGSGPTNGSSAVSAAKPKSVIILS